MFEIEQREIINVPENIKNILRKEIGEYKVLDDDMDRLLYSYDATRIKMLPSVVVIPETEEEVRKVVSICYQEGIPVTPRGAGSGYTGGALPVKGGVLVSFEKMDRILEIDEENAVARVQPGVVTYKLQQEVEKRGLFYPPDPASYKFCTIGGNVAENAGGPRCVKYGVTREYVMELNTVIYSGEIIHTGRPTLKDVAGYDITRVLIGSEGTLGLFTEITLKLIPKPKASKTVKAIFSDIASVGKTVKDIFKAGISPSALEFMDKLAINAVEDFGHFGLPRDAEVLLLIEVDGHPKALEEEIVEVARICELNGASVEIAQTDREAENLWTARRSLSPAVSKLGRVKINEDIVFPRSYLPEALPQLRDIGKRYNLKMVNFGHIGDGNVHANFMISGLDPDELKRTEKAVEEVFDLALKYGGSITGEHGVGITKASFMKKMFKPKEIEIMRGIKSVFDPEGLINPGKMGL
ncbi:MAG TPA: FAD-binding oxidoreductase [Persephonella sp.]|uniref:D-lactate dehydrogenase n=1 Tax=Persephonella marina (strain DSM 14350 / EX-H1) TaxID=123214 RepID=C0QS81_PERMH|nr:MULTISPECIES: FAD-linked oxidase C-terminal domain-containing protein [Persephonella]ACO04530.1 D-lactate dehydrogenase [Persephonella marina EX-H1]HCB69270.1 FAD-binding oxidoreductase [Persephonella sp.]